jgi:hypothetical protein
VLKSFEKPFLYEGFDISAPLVEAAKLSYSKNTNFSVSLIKDDFTGVPLNDMYDFSVSVHVAEICTSIEKLFYTLSTSSKNSAVLWYEFPRFEFTEMEIKKYVNHDFSHKEISTPYLRNKYSKSFYNHLLERFSLEVTKQISVSEKDTLVVYRRKSA